MSSAAEEHVIYRIVNAPIQDYPYAHIYVENVFPADFYKQLRIHWPDSTALTTLADTGRVKKGLYRDRFVLPFTPSGIGRLPEHQRAFWMEFGSWFMAERFRSMVIAKFKAFVKQRLGNDREQCQFESDSLLVRDQTSYSIGPHSDAPHRLLSLLFYCPDDETMKHLGTSLYVPLEPQFRCQGGPHYSRDKFRNVITMEYRPNTLFAFFKTDNSFHGVEPITDEHVQRDLLLYDVRVLHSRKPALPEKLHAEAGLGLKMLRNLFRAKNQ